MSNALLLFLWGQATASGTELLVLAGALEGAVKPGCGEARDKALPARAGWHRWPLPMLSS